MLYIVKFFAFDYFGLLMKKKSKKSDYTTYGIFRKFFTVSCMVVSVEGFLGT